jgi:hypothetical protein
MWFRPPHAITVCDPVLLGGFNTPADAFWIGQATMWVANEIMILPMLRG